MLNFCWGQQLQVRSGRSIKAVSLWQFVTVCYKIGKQVNLNRVIPYRIYSHDESLLHLHHIPVNLMKSHEISGPAALQSLFPLLSRLLLRSLPPVP